MIPIGAGTANFFNRATAQMADLRREAEGLQQQISTGQRLTASSDDPVAAARLRALGRTDRLAQVDQTAAEDTRQSLQFADDILGTIGNEIARARELAVQAANDTLSNEARALIGLELEAIASNLLDVANATDNAGRPLFAGDSDGPAYTLDASGQPVYNGTADPAQVNLGDGVIVARGVTGPEVFDFTTNGSPANLIAFVKSLALALQGGAADPGAAARGALEGFGDAFDSLSRSQTAIGVRVAWVETVQDRQITNDEARTEEQISAGGVDFASTIAELQQTLVVLEASQAAFARMSNLTLFNAI